MNRKDIGEFLIFIKFCEEHPELRFWQALAAFVEADMIEVDGEDPFYWKGIKGK